MSSSFSDVTESVGISAVDGYLAAFGDFNADKQTDLFIVINGGKVTVHICLFDTERFVVLNKNLLGEKRKRKVLMVHRYDLFLY